MCASHGAGKIVSVEQREVLGRRREYLVIQLSHNRMTVMIPVENAESRLRKVIAADAVEKVLDILRRGSPRMPERWHDRSRRIREKLGTGDVHDVAEVVRYLALRDADKGLALGEKQLFAKARGILASEVMHARDLSAGEAAALVEDVLGATHAQRPAPLGIAPGVA